MRTLVLYLRPSVDAGDFFRQISKQVRTWSPEEKAELRDGILQDMLRAMPCSETVQ